MTAPPQRHDPLWLAGQRQDGWLKLGPDVFFAGGRRHLWVMQLLLAAVSFQNLGKRPVLGPPLPGQAGHPPVSLMTKEQRHAATRRGEPLGERRDTRWEPIPGARGQVLRCVPRATVASALALAIHVTKRARRSRAAQHRHS